MTLTSWLPLVSLEMYRVVMKKTNILDSDNTHSNDDNNFGRIGIWSTKNDT